MSRMPIRLRLTVGFALAVGLVLVVLGSFASTRLAKGFSDDLDRELQQRAQDISGALQNPRTSLAALAGTGFIERGESFVELQSSRGAVVEATASLGHHPVLTPQQAAQAARTTSYVDLPFAPGLDEPARVLATPLRRGDRRLVLVVGDTKQNGIEELARIRRDMLLLGPLLLIVTSAIAYVVTGAALRPVELMRQRAAAMGGETPGQRLPLPRAQDELFRLGATLNDLLARVDEAMERERSFVANASHELRTPLALLRTELELALRRPRATVDLEAAIASAVEEVDRLSRLADDLLALSRASRDGHAVSTAPIVVPQLLETACRRFAPRAAAAGRRLTTSADGVRTVQGDQLGLTRALDNLLDNAMQHGEGDVVVESREVDGAVEIHVLDDGPGIPEALRPTVFHRFVRSPESSGSGLGLAIVAAVASAHGGATGSRIRPGGGADVWLRLPLEQTAAEQSSPLPQGESGTLPAPAPADHLR